MLNQIFQPKKIIILFLSVLLYLASIVVVFYGTKNFRLWPSLFISILAITIPVLVFNLKNWFWAVLKLIKNLKKEQKIFLSAAIAFSFIIHFFLLGKFPYTSWQDEVRDGGLQTKMLFENKANPLGYGAYEAQGTVIAEMTMPFYYLFPNSVYAYRIPAAILGFLSTILVWIIIQLLMTKKQKKNSQTQLLAILAIFILAALPLHMYYSRTEIVINSSTFLTLILVLLSLLLIQNCNVNNLIAWSLIAGFSFNFHTSTKIAVLVIAIYTLAALFLSKRKEFWLILISFFFFFFVGFGPRIIFTRIDNFSYQQQETFTSESNNSSFLSQIIDRYHQSFFVYFNQPTTARCPYHQPIVPLYLQPFFFVGLVYLLFQSTKTGLIAFLLLIFPLTNSALSNILNGAHRLSPLFSLSVIAIILGLTFLFEKFARNINSQVKKITSWLIILIIIIISVKQTLKIFNNRLFEDNQDIYRFLTVNTVNLLKKHPASLKQVCFISIPEINDYFQPMHVQEYFEYFLPRVKINTSASQFPLKYNVGLIVAKKCNPEKISSLTRIKFCPYEQNKTLLNCPKASNQWGAKMIDNQLRLLIDNDLL